MDTVVPEVPQVVDASVKPGSVPDANKVEIYRNVFDEFDLDHGGTISVSELADAMRKLSGGLPVTDEAIKEMMASVDNDGSGDIGFDEFCKLMAARSDPAEELQAAFLAFDVDGSGSISAVEVRTLLSHSIFSLASAVEALTPVPVPHCARRSKLYSPISALKLQTTRLMSSSRWQTQASSALTPPNSQEAARSRPSATVLSPNIHCWLSASPSAPISSIEMLSTYPHPLPFPLACADRSGELSFKEFQVMIQSNNSSTVHPARFESGCPHPFAPGTDGPGTDALIGPATYASAASRNIWLSAGKCVLRWPRCRRRP